MKLLVLGGTKFLGRATVEEALRRGHKVTLFNRGETSPELFPEAEKLRGDRTADLSALGARSWDAVVDTSGYVPRVVEASARALAGRVEHYLFVSSVSAYADFSESRSEDDATAELGDMPDDRLLDDYSNYGPLKALSEEAVRGVYGDSALIVRPGLIVGPHDPTGRFTYWPHRLARGGEVLAPGPPERPVQFVDVRDLAAWIVDASERQLTGAFNATSEPHAFADVVAGADVTWVDDAFLLEREVGEWMELPLWISDPDAVAMHEVDVSRAVAAGLTFRPLEETVRDTLDHAATVDGVGLTPVREAELLAAAT
jgi:nucleoside-diphosphate-sugar epimerase